MDLNDILAIIPILYTPSDIDLVKRAYSLAERAHYGQVRVSGEPYLNHCISVAKILLEINVPPSVVAAGLLHDTVEDTALTLDEIIKELGEEIAIMVNGVTKLTHLPRVTKTDQLKVETSTDENEYSEVDQNVLPEEKGERSKIQKSRKYDLVSETLRKTFLAMSDDVRVVLIKLADRLHNMRTLGFLPEKDRERIAQETLEIFAPLANRLGIWHIKWELEDLSFRYVNPEKYKEIAKNLAERRENRQKEMEAIKHNLELILSENGIQADISARPKHIYSIYKKMERKGVPFDLVHDIRGVRIIVDDVPTCYTSLGVIHTHWRPIQGEFDDYIAAPKDNYYRSLHTAVIYDDAKNVEIQIRTPDMDQSAEYGIAAHWRYKEGLPRDEEYERRIAWLRSLIEWKQDVEDAGEFVDSLKSDVFEERVYVFTPKGDIIDLPKGSTSIDFAYHVHTDVGNRCRGAKVDGKLVTLDYELKTGEKVEILTAKKGGPSRDWLNTNLGLVKTQRAKSKIKHWFKKQVLELNLSQGKVILDRELRRLGLLDINIERMTRELEYRSVDDFYIAIGTGDLPLIKVVRYLNLGKVSTEEQFTPQVKAPKSESNNDNVTVLGLRGLLTSMGKCCNPAPGDEIIGYITRGRGATIHRNDCPNILRVEDRERLIKVSWGEPKITYPVPIRIRGYDREGLVKDIWTLIADEGINIIRANVDTQRINETIIDLVLEVRDIIQLSRVLDRIENISNISEAVRVRPG